MCDPWISKNFFFITRNFFKSIRVYLVIITTILTLNRLISHYFKKQKNEYVEKNLSIDGAFSDIFLVFSRSNQG